MYESKEMNNLFDDILYLLSDVKDFDKLYDIKNILTKEPTKIDVFIRDMFDEYYNEDMYKTDDILHAFEHEVRKLCVELNYDRKSENILKRIKPSSEYVDHYCELKVDGYELDIWISEDNNSPFDPRELAWTIFNIYCGKVVF